ncbi:FlgO family outer membrane protein [Desulfovibrio mangrovi]|uniref:FlgO family outer membrane protein n=1 Tax=Desulfovibrio mangrovi TaxID=2976983 RepID=UPI002248132D|nr:FlgO family outer membrane protein [Desulfovibrio mangrovi]UZP67852.1 FlgO family outer membrane protein [Desulfovibrio mangrovi]
MLHIILRTVTMLVCLLLPVAASADMFDFMKKEEKPVVSYVTLPSAAFKMGEMLDAQLVERLNLLEGPAKGYTLIVTTPVDLNDLEASSPLARQMGEELALWFVQSGYKVQEIRKGRTVLFEPNEGEMLLTRRQTLLGNENIRSSLIMVTTYTQSRKSIRFNTRLLHAATNEVLAMSSQTIPLNSEMRTLAVSTNGKSGAQLTGIMPSVGTRLP